MKDQSSPHFSISRQKLYLDLYHAYLSARQHKRTKNYQVAFEMNYEESLSDLCDEILSRTYKPQRSTCFMVYEPKMREVFAAEFRDRVIHHLIYNYVHVLFERTFIADTYSCIPKRGTLYGVQRLEHHIRSQSQNYTRPCYILKLDVRGYFMHIKRTLLLRLCRKTLAKMKDRPSDVRGLTWGQKLDYDLLDYLLEVVVLLNPITDCEVIGNREDWKKLPADKSLFTVEEGRGLPIGNLTSQLFSNIYLNEFDQFVKRELGCKHYGRYVDDVFVVGSSKAELRRLIPRMEEFLNTHLGLGLHRRKVLITPVHYGVEFLGSYVMPWRTYISHHTLRRMRGKMYTLNYKNPRELQGQVNSRLGLMVHTASYKLRCVMFLTNPRLRALGEFTRDVLRYYPWGLGRKRSPKKVVF